jgi:hypothetical protein
VKQSNDQKACGHFSRQSTLLRQMTPEPSHMRQLIVLSSHNPRETSHSLFHSYNRKRACKQKSGSTPKYVMNECAGPTKRDAGSAVREQSFGLDFWFFWSSKRTKEHFISFKILYYNVKQFDSLLKFHSYSFFNPNDFWFY